MPRNTSKIGRKKLDHKKKKENALRYWEVILQRKSWFQEKVRYKEKFAIQSYMRAFGDGPRNFEPWSSDVDDTSAGTPSPNYHTNGRTSQLSTDLECITALRGGSLVEQGSNS
ncbi:hypothetical protein TNCV_4542751 [Trichonephila clavipes]|nr:hypothetical protein TNCV_4542751 [Trichonephila clavipes]